MRVNITVSSLDNLTSWKKELKGEESKKALEIFEADNCRVVAIVPATLKPVRTNSFRSFAKDFFLPTTLNHAVKVQHTAKKVFNILGSLALDIPTFPIRLITCLPRALSNAYRKQHPLKNYLISQGAGSKLLEAGRVKVRLEWEETRGLATTLETRVDGTQHTNEGRNRDRCLKERNVNFIEVPSYPGDAYILTKTVSGFSA